MKLSKKRKSRKWAPTRKYTTYGIGLRKPNMAAGRAVLADLSFLKEVKDVSFPGTTR